MQSNSIAKTPANGDNLGRHVTGAGKMRRNVLTVIIFILLAAPGAQARPDHNGSFTVLGTGAHSCGTWVADRKANGWAAVIDEAWVVGFLSAYNLLGPSPDDITAGSDVNGATGWMDNYCTQHPLDTISVATQALINELNKRRKSAS
jgi:hypothetical protein